MSNVMPHYARLDKEEREDFLSKIGNFSSDQISIFHQLCLRWAPEINYQKFAVTLSGGKLQHRELSQLLKILQRSGFAVITYKFKEATSEIEHIILCEEYSVRYWYYRLRNEFRRVIHSGILRLLFLEDLDLKQIGDDPKDAFIRINTEQFVPSEIKSISPDPFIIGLSLKSGKTVLIPSDDLTLFINRVLSYLRIEAKREHHFEGLARALKTNLNELENHIQSKDPVVWSSLSKGILLMQNDSRIKKIDENLSTFYEAAEILLLFLSNQIQESKKKLAEKKQRDEDLKDLALRIKAFPEKIVSQQVFNDLAESYSSEYDVHKFKEDFYSKFTKIPEGSGVPDVLFTGGSYIHRSNLYNVFAARIKEQTIRLNDWYYAMMADIVRTNNRGHRTMFYSLENFNSDIKKQIEGNDPILFDMVKRPRIIWESLFLKSGGKDSDKVKAVLSEYFDVDTMKLLPLSRIMKLSMLRLFEQAFASFGLWRQLMLRITGKYASYYERFAGFYRSHSTAIASRRFTMDDDFLPGPGKKIPVTRGKRNKKKAKPIPKNYTKTQRDKAWDDFNRTLKS